MRELDAAFGEDLLGATIAALAFSVSKIVSMRMISAPPSTSPGSARRRPPAPRRTSRGDTPGCRRRGGARACGWRPDRAGDEAAAAVLAAMSPPRGRAGAVATVEVVDRGFESVVGLGDRGPVNVCGLDDVGAGAARSRGWISRTSSGCVRLSRSGCCACRGWWALPPPPLRSAPPLLPSTPPRAVEHEDPLLGRGSRSRLRRHVPRVHDARRGRRAYAGDARSRRLFRRFVVPVRQAACQSFSGCVQCSASAGEDEGFGRSIAFSRGNGSRSGSEGRHPRGDPRSAESETARSWS